VWPPPRRIADAGGAGIFIDSEMNGDSAAEFRFGVQPSGYLQSSGELHTAPNVPTQIATF